MGKKDIAVTALFSQDGKVTPLSIEWEDGRSFEIDKVLDVRRAASLKAGGIGTRYHCRIRNRELYLYLDEYNWFMEVDD